MSRQPRRSRATSDSYRPPPIPIPGRSTDVRFLISHFEQRVRNPDLFAPPIPPANPRHHHHRHTAPLPAPNTVRALVDCFNRLVGAFTIRPVVYTSSLSDTMAVTSTDNRSKFQPRTVWPNILQSSTTSLRKEKYERVNDRPVVGEAPRGGYHWKGTPLSPTGPLEEITVSGGDNRETIYRPLTPFNSVRVWKVQRDNYFGAERSVVDGNQWEEPQTRSKPAEPRVMNGSRGRDPVKYLEEQPWEGSGSRASGQDVSQNPVHSVQSSAGPVSQHSEKQRPSLRSVSRTSAGFWRDTHLPPTPSPIQSSAIYRSFGRASKPNVDRLMLDSGPIPRVIVTPPPHAESLTNSSSQYNIGTEQVEVSDIRERFEKIEQEATLHRKSGSWRGPGIDIATGRVITTGEMQENANPSITEKIQRTNLRHIVAESTSSRAQRDREQPPPPKVRSDSVETTAMSRRSTPRPSIEPPVMKWLNRSQGRQRNANSPMPGSFPVSLGGVDYAYASANTIGNQPIASKTSDSIRRGTSTIKAHFFGGTELDFPPQPHGIFDRPQKSKNNTMDTPWGRRSTDSFGSVDTMVTAREERTSSPPLRSSISRDSSLRSVAPDRVTNISHNRFEDPNYSGIRQTSSHLSEASQFPSSLIPQDQYSSTYPEQQFLVNQDPMSSPMRSPSLIVEMGFPPLQRRPSVQTPPSMKGYVAPPRMRIRPDHGWLHAPGSDPKDIPEAPRFHRSARSDRQGSMDGASDIMSQNSAESTESTPGERISDLGSHTNSKTSNTVSYSELFPRSQDTHVSNDTVEAFENNYKGPVFSSPIDQPMMEPAVATFDTQTEDRVDISAPSSTLPQQSKVHFPEIHSHGRESTISHQSGISERLTSLDSAQSGESNLGSYVSPASPVSGDSEFQLSFTSSSRDGRESAQMRLKRIEETASSDQSKKQKGTGFIWNRWWG